GALSILVSLAGVARRLCRLSGAGDCRPHAGRVATVRRLRPPVRPGRSGVDGGCGSGRAASARMGSRCVDYRSSGYHRTVMQAPTLKDVYEARQRVYRHLRPTPLMRHPLLAMETGLDIRVKHENHNPTGAFKV